MYLKALELQGFKSFPEKTRLTFEKDITAIVGPNGSGKSNISDAILWVMGEQRTKALRGGKMEDVVFGGTEARPKMGFAQVSLILDNSERFFDTDSTEVMITRRYYRSGESEYYINRESVRLRDITELLMDTGLGRYGYSIIGQGKISEVVSAKSGDRRELFEEAAGISRYRSRKDESERKLQHTEENLVRINDKIDELKLQVDPLREQAETAKKYLKLRDELRLVEVSLWMDSLDKLRERAETVAADWEKAQADLEAARSGIGELYAASENFSEKMREKDIATEEERGRLARAEAEVSELESRLAVLENSGRHNQERREQLLTEIGEQETRARALEEQIARRHGRIDEIEKELSVLERKMKELADKAGEYEADSDSARRGLNELYARKSDRQAELSRWGTVLSMLADAERDRAEAAADRESGISETGERLEELEAQVKQRLSELKEAAQRRESAENVIAGHKIRLEGRQAKVKNLQEKKTALTIELNAVSSRAAMLADMEKEYEGYSKAVKTVMRESERAVLKGVHGPVAGLVKADERFALAIETALGGSMQSIVVDTQEQGKAAIELLKRRDAGRATFLPISTIKPAEIKSVPSGEEGFLGTAFELARFDGAYSGIFSSLLARTVVAETLADAVRMSKRHDNRLRIVTLDGQLINPGGSMTGGSAARNTGILSRANELKALLEKKEGLEKNLADCSAALSEAERELSSAAYELQTAEFERSEADEEVRLCETERERAGMMADEARRKLAALEAEAENEAMRAREAQERAEKAGEDIERLEREIADIDRELEAAAKAGELREREAKELSENLSVMAEKRSSLISEKDTTELAIEQLKELFDDLIGDGDARRATIEELEAEGFRITRETETAGTELEKLREKCQTVREGLSAINAQKLELEGKRTQAEKRAQEANRELLDLERLAASIEQKKLASEMEEKQIIDKLWDGYELSRTAAQAVRQPIDSQSAAAKRVGGLKREISALGSPNIGAIEEYERVSVRYNFLTEQRDDVEKAKKELEKIITDITGEMKEIFRREFNAIDESFRKTFLELFGGGKAALVLEDEEDILGCGIEIKVQPPGKALTTLSLLSGGETAFVAIALYFAILKVRPSPFCVMDEIEAALDEANVDRYARYMRGMTDKTQFIVITHRRGTMEEADMLYGVTMQEKGVSQVISVDLEEAERSIGELSGKKANK